MNDVLVVIDMQNDFIDGALGTQEARQIVPRVVARIRGHMGPILATRDTHDDNYLHSQEGHHLPIMHCKQNTDGWALHPDVAKALSGRPHRMIDKPSFGSLALAESLTDLAKEKLLTSITFVGLCTDICVISNALIAKAALPEVPIYVDAAACAGVSPESHERALDAMSVCQVVVLHG